ncbi:unnamed protein product [Schistosoma margrebowiei]|uniref:Uncharacterized protein n=1 Tax=Schistosoma margrebowiei TaxID=48269 RepID=A0A183MPY0_9TREM|nr:unnamed protein product [Schistosoma margrebowiei]
MVVGGSRQETLDPGFMLLGTRQQGVPVILREPVLPDGLNPVSPSFTVRDVTTYERVTIAAYMIMISSQIATFIKSFNSSYLNRSGISCHQINPIVDDFGAHNRLSLRIQSISDASALALSATPRQAKQDEDVTGSPDIRM